MPGYSVVITASFIKSHPSIEFIKCVIESLKHIHMDEDTQIILAHDYSEDSRFAGYLENLEEYISAFRNMRIVVRTSHGHLTGNVRNAFNFINTEYVLILQHDLPFVRDLDIEKVIEDMRNNPELKHVRFNKRANTKMGTDALNELFGKQIMSRNYTYTRTPAWSDQNHLCRCEYYRDIILKECDDGKYMESYLIKKSSTEEIHDKYGTFIFDKINEPACIDHIDGRNYSDVKEQEEREELERKAEERKVEKRKAKELEAKERKERKEKERKERKEKERKEKERKERKEKERKEKECEEKERKEKARKARELREREAKECMFLKRGF